MLYFKNAHLAWLIMFQTGLYRKKAMNFACYLPYRNGANHLIILSIKHRSGIDMSEKAETAEKPSGGKKGIIIMAVVAILAIGAGAGGAWFFLQGQPEDEYEPARPKKIPTAFKELDIFTVNLQPEERNQYLQVGLTVKIRDTDVSMEIDKKMPEIRNRILLLLTSKTAPDISSLAGKQQLSTEITEEIRKTMDSDMLREEIMEVLFTSFVIQ